MFIPVKKKHVKHKDERQEQESYYLIPKNEPSTESLASTPWQQTCTLPEHSGKFLDLIQVKPYFFKRV